MNEARGLVEPDFDDAADPRLFDLGRPRTVLAIAKGGARVLGGAEPAARRAGAAITHATIDDVAGIDARFDLVVIDGALLDRVAVIEAAVARVAAGGRLLATTSRSRVAAVQASLLRAGMTAPRVSTRAAPFAVERLVVARKPAAPGPLTLTVGMLTRDEMGSIARMIDDIRAVAPDARLLVVDGSRDATPDIARAKGARVVRQLPPRGHAAAMRRLMYEAAAESDALVYVDCDCTYPVHEIPRIRARLEAGAEVVNATRTHRRPRAMPVTHFLANRVFAATLSAVHGMSTPDVHSGMRGYRASVVRAFDFDGRGDALPIDTLVLPARAGHRVEELPIDYLPRVGESKLARVRGTAWTFVRIARALEVGERVAVSS